MKTKTILKAINNPFVNLYKGEGYWYFTYDDPANNFWHDWVVPVYRLNYLAFDKWVEDGRTFVKECEEKINDNKSN